MEEIPIRITDSDVKKMIEKTNRIYTKVEVIETKIIEIVKHMEAQNGKLSKHSGFIQDLRIDQESLKTKMWMVFVVGGVVIGIISSVATRFLLGG